MFYQTFREELFSEGFVAFRNVIPEDLNNYCRDTINADPRETWPWKDSERFRTWLQGFLEAMGFGFRMWNDEIHVFNRPPGNMMWWHHDNDGGAPTIRRVFIANMFVPTTRENAAFRVIPRSHKDGTYETLKRRGTEMRVSMGYAPALGRIREAYRETRQKYPEFFLNHPQEKVFELPAGSLVVCDERILHGTTMNDSDQRRPMALWWLWKAEGERELPGG